MRKNDREGQGLCPSGTAIAGKLQRLYSPCADLSADIEAALQAVALAFSGVGAADAAHSAAPVGTQPSASSPTPNALEPQLA